MIYFDYYVLWFQASYRNNIYSILSTVGILPTCQNHKEGRFEHSLFIDIGCQCQQILCCIFLLKHTHFYFHCSPTSVSECQNKVTLQIFLVVIMEHIAIICLRIYPQITGTKILKQESKCIEIFLQPYRTYAH